VDLIEIPVGDGDRFLLCSDGLTGMVSDEEITSALSSTRSLELIVRSLIDLANERGGVDNITAIMVEVKSASSVSRKPSDASREKTSVSLRAMRKDEDDITPTEGMPIPVIEEPPKAPEAPVEAPAEPGTPESPAVAASAPVAPEVPGTPEAPAAPGDPEAPETKG
jgi:hypothetical protein